MEYNPKKEFSFFLQLADLKDPLDLTLIPSNPNFDADIAFLCDSIEDFLTLSPIVKAMPEAEFVFFYRSYSKDPKERINLLIEANYLLKLASKDNLYCRLYYLDNRIEQSMPYEFFMELRTMFNFFEKYKIMGTIIICTINTQEKITFL
jgi:hypothetical protein